MPNICNPWHGGKKISEGCLNCYMYFLNTMKNQDGRKIICNGCTNCGKCGG